MADALVDFAALDSGADAVVTDSTVEATEVTSDVDTPSLDSEVEVAVSDDTTTAADKETGTHNADGTEKTPEEQEAFKIAAAAKTEADKGIETKATPDNVRKALKAMRDADPKNAAVVKELHGAFERFNAYKTEFPTVAAAKEAKAFIDAVGGPEGYQKMQESIDAVIATDELLYAADPKLWDNVIEDLKTAGHPEALGALAPSYLSKLKEHDKTAYYETIQPHFFEGLKEVGMDRFLNSMNEALLEKDAEGKPAPNLKNITATIAEINRWFKEQEKEAQDKAKGPVDTPERKKFLAEKAEFERTKTEDGQRRQKKFESGVAEECDKYNNKALGKVLGTYLRMPFFKDFPYDTKVDLGNGIKDRLYAALKADKAYQTQMSAMWKQKNPDRVKMVQYHTAKLNTIAEEIVRATVQNRCPGYAKGGSAAGRVAAATVKKVADNKAAVASVASGKPIYVASRPENLVREPIKVGSREYSAADLVTLQIMGKGFVKSGDGKSFKYITWRK